MARFILITIIAFIALTFLMTFLKGLLRRAINAKVSEAAQNLASEQQSSSPASVQKELYRKNGVVVLQGEQEVEKVRKN